MNGSRGQVPAEQASPGFAALVDFFRLFPLFSASASLLTRLASCFSDHYSRRLLLAQSGRNVYAGSTPPHRAVIHHLSGCVEIFLAEISGSSQDGSEAMPQLFAYFVGKMAILGGVSRRERSFGTFVFRGVALSARNGKKPAVYSCSFPPSPRCI